MDPNGNAFNGDEFQGTHDESFHQRSGHPGTARKIFVSNYIILRARCQKGTKDSTSETR